MKIESKSYTTTSVSVWLVYRVENVMKVSAAVQLTYRTHLKGIERSLTTVRFQWHGIIHVPENNN